MKDNKIMKGEIEILIIGIVVLVAAIAGGFFLYSSLQEKETPPQTTNIFIIYQNGTPNQSEPQGQNIFQSIESFDWIEGSAKENQTIADALNATPEMQEQNKTEAEINNTPKYIYQAIDTAKLQKERIQTEETNKDLAEGKCLNPVFVQAYDYKPGFPDQYGCEGARSTIQYSSYPPLVSWIQNTTFICPDTGTTYTIESIRLYTQDQKEIKGIYEDFVKSKC